MASFTGWRRSVSLRGSLYVIDNIMVMRFHESDPRHGRSSPKGVQYSASSSSCLRIESEEIVISSQAAVPPAEVCAQIKKSGYAASQNVRIYGEEFEVLSDPFPNEIGIAIRVRSRRTSQVRHLQLPATLIHRVGSPPRAA